MRGWTATRRGRALLVGAPLLPLLLATAWLRSTTAQDATPMATPSGGPADCAPPLGLPAGSACLVVVHASPDAPDVDVYVDGEAVVEGLPFGSASSYLGLPSGQHEIQITAAGSPAEEAVVAGSFALEAGLAYEVAAVGRLESITAAILLANLDPLEDDRARIRVFQAIPDAPPAEVGFPGGDVLLPEITYGSATGYAEVPAGETPIDLEVRPAEAPVVFSIAGATLEPGLVYTFYAIGDLADPTGLRVLPVAAPASGAATAGAPLDPLPAIPLAVATPGPAPAATPAA